MASRKISIPKGFTLLEILVVMGLVLMVVAFGLIVSFDDYRGFTFRNERDIVVSVIQKARGQAINNMCFGAGCTDGKAHGVYFGTPGEYVVFQGTSYATRDVALDEVIAARDNASVVSGMTSVVFNRLRADTTTVGGTTLTITQPGHTSTITVEPEGRVWWTN
ncbi:MAG TPA: prepilin-type N-terminal cleavage/methylation domain-containing protein [Candidatus Paceibacterota bacterium]|nr:prepilin-type N-terminal cleavage/methylation domain-containing protein [Candidatus Paceibacterota bacterium]